MYIVILGVHINNEIFFSELMFFSLLLKNGKRQFEKLLIKKHIQEV